jgi:Carboxypeptidase regulatory-like domain/Viral BACON domain
VTITATDSTGAQAQGSPQVFSVSLNVTQPAQPCQFSVSPANPLAFTVPNAPAQTVTLSESGRCAFPVSWSAAADSGSSSWLVISPNSGSDTGTNATFNVSVNAANLSPGSYTGQITVSANDAGGNQLQGSPQTIIVNLTVPSFTVSGSVIACSDAACTNPAPLPGATLTVFNGSNQVATATADPSGTYTLPLAPGTYTVNVSGTDSNGTHYTGTATLAVTGNQSNFTINAF